MFRCAGDCSIVPVVLTKRPARKLPMHHTIIARRAGYESHGSGASAGALVACITQ
jgi:hypothetical protein